MRNSPSPVHVTYRTIDDGERDANGTKQTGLDLLVLHISIQCERSDSDTHTTPYAN